MWNKVTETGIQKFRHPAIACFFVQLLFNAMWSPIFFGLRHPDCALLVLVLMIGFTLKTMYYSHKYRYNVCTYLLIPYLFWICYASTLNGAIVVLN